MVRVGTARALAASGADVLALEELTEQAVSTYEKALATAYPYHVVRGAVGLWSRTRLSGTRPVDVEMDHGPAADTLPVDVLSSRALRTTVATGHGPLVAALSW